MAWFNLVIILYLVTQVIHQVSVFFNFVSVLAQPSIGGFSADC